MLKKHCEKHCLVFFQIQKFFVVLRLKWISLFHNIVNKRRYAHHLVVEKRRKLTHECKKLA